MGSRQGIMLLLSCFVILSSCYVQPSPAASTVGTSACDSCMSSLTKEMLRVVWTTLETGTRGFLLGFGGAILKDLVDKKATVQESASDFTSTFRLARVVGLGTACFLVGMAVA